MGVDDITNSIEWVAGLRDLRLSLKGKAGIHMKKTNYGTTLLIFIEGKPELDEYILHVHFWKKYITICKGDKEVYRMSNSTLSSKDIRGAMRLAASKALEDIRGHGEWLS